MSKKIERFHYFRWHSHPLGWGVCDSKHDCVVALGDKDTCATIADLYNGKPVDMSLWEGAAKMWDDYVKAGAPIWQPETD